MSIAYTVKDPSSRVYYEKGEVHLAAKLDLSSAMRDSLGRVNKGAFKAILKGGKA